MSSRAIPHQYNTLTIHIDKPERLLEYVERAECATELVVTPEQLHRRNLKRRCAMQRLPRSSMQFVGPTQIAGDIIKTAGGTLESLDRLDRIRLLETLIDASPADFDAFRPLYGTQLQHRPTAIEATRAAVGAMTAFQDERVRALREVIEACPQPARADGMSHLDGALAVQSGVTEAAGPDVHTGTDALIRRAIKLLEEDGERIWKRTYPEIRRVHVAGIGSLRAPLLDLLHAMDTHTPVDIRLYLRGGTGPRIAAFLNGDSQTAIERQPVTVSTPSTPTEVIATTRAQEARAAIAIADYLLDSGVSPSDIVLTARTVNTYETELNRAAQQYGRSISVWTQLQLTDTMPYRLLDSLCTLLTQQSQDRQLSSDVLARAIALEWVAPEPHSQSASRPWVPITNPRTQLSTVDAVDTESRQSASDWLSDLGAAEGDQPIIDRLRSLLQWLEARPSEPTPGDVRDAFVPVFDAHCNAVLPTYPDRDDPALTATIETSRAVDRIVDATGRNRSAGLIGQTATKYADWLDRGQLTPSWDAVHYLAAEIATATPGRREHAHGDVLDVLDATNTWLREAPFVIALGFVDGEWPQRPSGLFPPEVQARIRANETPATQQLPARQQWSTDQEYDHFNDAVGMASEHLICTRHRRAHDGTTAHRSPFLDVLNTARVSVDTTAALLSTDRTLPPRLVAALAAAPQVQSPRQAQASVEATPAEEDR